MCVIFICVDIITPIITNMLISAQWQHHSTVTLPARRAHQNGSSHTHMHIPFAVHTLYSLNFPFQCIINVFNLEGHSFLSAWPPHSPLSSNYCKKKEHYKSFQDPNYLLTVHAAELCMYCGSIKWIFQEKLMGKKYLLEGPRAFELEKSMYLDSI